MFYDPIGSMNLVPLSDSSRQGFAARLLIMREHPTNRNAHTSPRMSSQMLCNVGEIGTRKGASRKYAKTKVVMTKPKAGHSWMHPRSKFPRHEVQLPQQPKSSDSITQVRAFKGVSNTSKDELSTLELSQLKNDEDRSLTVYALYLNHKHISHDPTLSTWKLY